MASAFTLNAKASVFFTLVCEAQAHQLAHSTRCEEYLDSGEIPKAKEVPITWFVGRFTQLTYSRPRLFNQRL